MDKRTESVEISEEGQGFLLVDVGTWLYSMSQFAVCFPHFYGDFYMPVTKFSWNRRKGKNPWLFFIDIQGISFYPDKLTGRKTDLL